MGDEEMVGRKMFYKNLFFLLLFFLPSCTSRHVLLSPPQKSTIKPEQYAQVILGERGEFSWGYGDKRCIAGWHKSLDTQNIYFIAEYLNELPKGLTEKEKNKFSVIEKDIDGVLTNVYSFHYGILPKKKTLDILQTQDLVKGSSRKKVEQLPKRDFHKITPKPKPQNLTLEECAYLINNKKVIFLTGAGISLAAKIPTSQTLHDSLGISEADSLDQFTKDLLLNPQKLVDIMQDFFNAIINAKPTLAHHTLTKIAMDKSCQIMTGNFDHLHEKAGIKAYNVEMNSLEKDWNKNVIEQIDVILCIGSSYDFMSILSKYKKFNPNGIIVAINKEQPDYLGNEDFFIKGDIQKIVPELTELLSK